MQLQSDCALSFEDVAAGMCQSLVNLKTAAETKQSASKDDIYYLYSLNGDKKEEQFGIAHIPDYNTSSMMNKLFRIIKENDNLDALEESDDEEEFENEKVDKFVKLDTSHKMVCQYNYKFKKWTPIRLYI